MKSLRRAASAGLAGIGLLLLLASGALAQGAYSNYWQCQPGTNGWCPVSTTYPLPVTGTVSGTVTANQGTAGSAGSAWYVQPGTNAVWLTPVTGVAANPTATLALPSTTSAYTAGWLICSSATVATCNSAIAANPITIGYSAGAVIIPRLRLSTNDATSTAWATQTITVDLWSAAPTFQTTGDRASFATDLLTGTGSHLGSFSCTFPAAAANSDGLYAECSPAVGNFATVKLASGTSIFWTLTATTGSGVTGASKTFTLTAETLN